MPTIGDPPSGPPCRFPRRGLSTRSARRGSRVEADDGAPAVRPAVPFSASGSLHEIRAAGIRDFFADVRDVPDGEIGKVLEALFSDRAIPGTSPFNLFRGNF